MVFIIESAPWCGHCKNLGPDWEKLANALNEIVGVGAIDMDAEKSFGGEYGIKGFPTLKFFADDKSKPIDYNGGRTFDDMLNFALDQVKSIAKNRASGKSAGSSSSSKKSGSSSSDDVVVLTDSNFNDLLMKSEEGWLVEFYAPWCGHCKKLEPTWKEVATKLKNKVKVAKVDSTVEKNTAGKFGIQGYPTIKFFPAGKKSEGNVMDYEGGRDEGSLVDFALQQFENSKPIQFEQLVNQEIFDKFCVKDQGACIIAFLPHIYDTTAEERKTVLKFVEEVADKNKGKPLSFLWAQGGEQSGLEEALALGSGYPAVIGLSGKRKVFATLKSALNKKSLESFVIGLSTGKEYLVPFKQLPNIKTVDKWDGKDKKPPTYDEEL